MRVAKDDTSPHLVAALRRSSCEYHRFRTPSKPPLPQPDPFFTLPFLPRILESLLLGSSLSLRQSPGAFLSPILRILASQTARLRRAGSMTVCEYHAIRYHSYRSTLAIGGGTHQVVSPTCPQKREDLKASQVSIAHGGARRLRYVYATFVCLSQATKSLSDQ